MLLDSFKRDIINQLVVADDGRVLRNPLSPYFRAFTGAFSADTPFTFYFEVKNKPVMFVYDSTPITARSSRAVFNLLGFNSPPFRAIQLGVWGICSPTKTKFSMRNLQYLAL
ncbi:hypothetical protein AGMMS49944_18680 [Spirochaetia bacterium]|nr:hypothetical protein AGMMS49944_18680 [Spirochaetia bacterium]